MGLYDFNDRNPFVTSFGNEAGLDFWWKFEGYSHDVMIPFLIIPVPDLVAFNEGFRMLFPLDRPRRLVRQVEEHCPHSRHAEHLSANLVEQIRRHPHHLGRHPIHRIDRP
jgi:hypothetical protein